MAHRLPRRRGRHQLRPDRDADEGDHRAGSTSAGSIGLLTTWQTYVAVGFGMLGVLVVQWALHTGPLLAAQPGFTLMDPLVSILWGVLVFNEVDPHRLVARAGDRRRHRRRRRRLRLARSPLFEEVNAEEAETLNPATL